MRRLVEYGDEIEADLKREYGVDLLDFYRGTLSARLLGVYVRHLSAKSSLSRALNGGETPWTRLEHLIADLWFLWAKQDHPRRAAMEAKARNDAKLVRVKGLRHKFEKLKRRYGIGGDVT